MVPKNAMRVIYTLLGLRGVAVLFTGDAVDTATIPPELYTGRVELPEPWGKGFIVANLPIENLMLEEAPVELGTMRLGGYLATFGFTRRAVKKDD